MLGSSFLVLGDDDDLRVVHAAILADVADHIFRQRVGEDLVDHHDVDARVAQQRQRAGRRTCVDGVVLRAVAVGNQRNRAARRVRHDHVDRVDLLLGDGLGKHVDDGGQVRHIATGARANDRFGGGVLDALVGALQRAKQRRLVLQDTRVGQHCDGFDGDRSNALLDRCIECATHGVGARGECGDAQLRGNWPHFGDRLVAGGDRRLDQVGLRQVRGGDGAAGFDTLRCDAGGVRGGRLGQLARVEQRRHVRGNELVVNQRPDNLAEAANRHVTAQVAVRLRQQLAQRVAVAVLLGDELLGDGADVDAVVVGEVRQDRQRASVTNQVERGACVLHGQVVAALERLDQRQNRNRVQLRQNTDRVDLAFGIVGIAQDRSECRNGELTMLLDELVDGGLTRAVVVAAVSGSSNQGVDRSFIARALLLRGLGAIEDRTSDLRDFALLGHEHVPLILRDGLVQVVGGLVGRITGDDLLQFGRCLLLLVEAKQVDGFL